LVTNVDRLARLGVPDYFVFDMARGRLHGYRLEGAAYLPLVPHAGRFEARALGLQLGLEGGKVRFYASTAPIPDEAELLERLATTLDDSVAVVADLEKRLAESEGAREEARAAREAEQKAREDAEARLAVALAQLAALTNKSDCSKSSLAPSRFEGSQSRFSSRYQVCPNLLFSRWPIKENPSRS
jgi:hypothetical protein